MYSSRVRIGNWQEELSVANEKAKLYKEKKERGELLVQKTERLFRNLLQKVALSKNVDFIKFGNRVQLKAPDMPGFPSSTKERNNYGVVVAGTVNERDINKTQKLTDNCSVVCSPLLVPSARNTFLIKSGDCHERDGKNLLFGQEFMLQVIDSENELLYVRSEIPFIDEVHGPLQHNPVRISNKKDSYCKWKVLHWDPNKRFETEGATIPPFTRIVVRHVMSGKCLAVEGLEWYNTIFGLECGISVHTYTDIHKRETAECLWTFVIGEN